MNNYLFKLSTLKKNNSFIPLSTILQRVLPKPCDEMFI